MIKLYLSGAVKWMHIIIDNYNTNYTEDKQMSKRTHLNKLDFYMQNNIKHVLLMNGWDQQDINDMWYKLTVGDVDDIIDFAVLEA